MDVVTFCYDPYLNGLKTRGGSSLEPQCFSKSIVSLSPRDLSESIKLSSQNLLESKL